MYVTLEEYREYAESVGVELTGGDEVLTTQLTSASQFIDSKEPMLRGKRTSRDQDHAYPRTDLVLNGFSYSDDEIPVIAKRCQMAIALEISEGIDLFDNSGILPVVKERVDGAVEVQYANPEKIQPKERDSIAMSLLRQLMRSPSLTIPLVRA